MKLKVILTALIVAGIALLFIHAKSAPQKSPKMVAEGKNVKITYGQPSKRGRVIFGGLVPYNEVWRTGANEATEITFNKDVLINNKEVKAGTYTLFTIPQKDKWTFILNSTLKQWGAFDYEKIKDKDILKTEAAVKKTKVQEKLTFQFKDNETGTVLVFMWDDVEVDLPIVFK